MHSFIKIDTAVLKRIVNMHTCRKSIINIITTFIAHNLCKTNDISFEEYIFRPIYFNNTKCSNINKEQHYQLPRVKHIWKYEYVTPIPRIVYKL